MDHLAEKGTTLINNISQVWWEWVSQNEWTAVEENLVGKLWGEEGQLDQERGDWSAAQERLQPPWSHRQEIWGSVLRIGLTIQKKSQGLEVHRQNNSWWHRQATPREFPWWGAQRYEALRFPPNRADTQTEPEVIVIGVPATLVGHLSPIIVVILPMAFR